ncbi:hypothetical protein CYD30_25045 [Kosakonia cowanii]|nr:hypothetical protein CYD30_25045 [Kosakonia cowanii]
MIKLFRKVLSVPERLMPGINQQGFDKSSNNKITTDANGNAMLNMNNKEVRESMQARMNELANKR